MIRRPILLPDGPKSEFSDFPFAGGHNEGVGMAAAQFETEQQQAPPEQKARFIGDQDLEARVGQLVGPTIEAWPEVANGFKENAAQR